MANPETPTKPETEPHEEESFVESSLKLGGKSEEEARTTAAVDRADEQVEAMFARKYQTVGSPVHRAVWDDAFPVSMFAAPEISTSPEVEKVMNDSIEIARRRRDDGTLLNDEGKITQESLDELGRAGYWGLLIDKQYGGQGASFVSFAKFLTRMSTVEPTIAGLASVHGCIGAVDPLHAFGSEEQKQRYLPLLASGERLSGFALTEPGAGSDLTALRTTARLDGDEYVVNGEKLFITNAIPGRTVGLVCKIEDQPAVLVVDLPDEENEHFQLVRYGLHALKQSYNNGLRFKDFRVPKENLLQPAAGDGLTIAYHGLNRGRIALCATAAGTMRVMLASIIPWAHYRRTYGEPIERRELVQRRIARLAGLIVACDALVEWGGWLLTEGFRGEMECIVAKIFGSEAQKEAAIEQFMKTHGGRAFLKGHLFGDNVHEFLAPCIYEGEGEMLGLAFFKSLVKEHGKRFFQPIGNALKESGIKQPNPLNPVHAWKLRKAIWPYAKWRIGETIGGPKRAQIPDLPDPLQNHARFAADRLQKARLELDNLMQKHQLKLADRQCAMAELSQRTQDLIVMLTTALYAGKQQNELVHAAADVICRDFKRGLTGERPSNKYFRTATKLGDKIATDGFPPLEGVQAPEILMQYD